MEMWKEIWNIPSWRRKSKNSSLQVPRSFQEFGKVSTKLLNSSDWCLYIQGKFSYNKSQVWEQNPHPATCPLSSNEAQLRPHFPVMGQLCTPTTGLMMLFLAVSVAHPCHANYIDSTESFPLFYFRPWTTNWNQRGCLFVCLGNLFLSSLPPPPTPW